MANSNFSESSNPLNDPPIPNRQTFLAIKKMADHQGSAEAQYTVGSCFKDGKWVSKSYKKGFYYYKLAADQGLSQAQASLALLYNEGLGVERDPHQAFYYAKLAADQANSLGCVLLGEFYAEGNGVETSTKESTRYYQIAAELGNPAAFSYLADAYENGIGVEKSEEKANLYYQKKFEYYKQRADEGDPESQATVGWLFENGTGIEKSMESAIHYYQLSADQDFPTAWFHLAECYAMGKGVKKDTEKAIHHYKLAADKKDISAKFCLAQFLLKNKRDEGKAVRYLQSIVQIPKIDPNLLACSEHDLAECFENGTGIKKSAQDALHYYELAAEHGNDLAQDRLGDAYLKGELGLTVSPEKAMQYYQLAANKGNPFSLMAIGKCYQDGVGVDKSLEIAFDYFKKSSDIALEKRLGTPIHKLAKCYELGIGVEKSLETAIYYYKIAGENGLIDSYHQMSRCYHELGGEENEKKAAAYLKIAEAGKKIETEEKITSMKSHHGFGSMQNFFFIDKESIKQLENGQDNVELVLDFRKDNLLSKETQEALKENRLGSYKNKGGRDEFNFPKEYLDLIERGQREGKLTKIVLLKTNEKQIIDVDPEDLLEESKESKKIAQSFTQDKKYLQVLSDITHCFPGLKKGEKAYLTYVNEELRLFNGEKLVMPLNHFTPWNMNEEAFNEILKSERLVVFVTSRGKDTIIHITKKCAKNLVNQGGLVFCYPYYILEKHLEEENHEYFKGFIVTFANVQNDFELKKHLQSYPESGGIAILAHTQPLQIFSQEQYASICKAGSSILACKKQLGGSENIAVGGMFVATNEKMNTPITAITLRPDPNQHVQYFYISGTELDKSKTNSNILQIKPIAIENIQNIQEWEKIVDESRLIAITKDEQKEKLLIHQRILEERLPLAQRLRKGDLPIAVEENHKYVIYKLKIPCSPMDQNDYNQLCKNIDSFVEEWFTQE